MAAEASTPLPASLDAFLTAHADTLDADNAHASAIVPALGESGLLRRGVPAALGGDGSRTADAVQAIAAVAERSLAAAFVFWGQRAFIEYLLQSPNAALRERWLPDLLAGRLGGATGLSNAMKFLSGIEALQIEAQTLVAPEASPGTGEGRFTLNGALPWSTNLRKEGFIVAVAVQRADGGAPFIAALPSDRAGLSRSDDLDLIAMRGTNTGALKLKDLALDEGDVIALNAKAWLPAVRPAFLGLQCGMSIGLARAALAAAQQLGGAARPVLQVPIDEATANLADAVAALESGLDDGRFITQAPALFRLRIRLAQLVQEAVQLELQASGGRGYHRDQPLQIARRWRESAFIPIVTPSLTQLEGELRKQAALAA